MMGKLVGMHMGEKIDNAHSLASVTSQVVQIVQSSNLFSNVH